MLPLIGPWSGDETEMVSWKGITSTNPSQLMENLQEIIPFIWAPLTNSPTCGPTRVWRENDMPILTGWWLHIRTYGGEGIQTFMWVIEICDLSISMATINNPLEFMASRLNCERRTRKGVIWMEVLAGTITCFVSNLLLRRVFVLACFPCDFSVLSQCAIEVARSLWPFSWYPSDCAHRYPYVCVRPQEDRFKRF